MSSRSTDILFLLGAGASVEAGIPASATMIDKIEALLNTHPDWAKFKELYNHVKSSIHYSSGIKGRFGRDVSYNIETLVIALYELERNEEHPLYPFIAAWNSRFVGLAAPDFSNVREFRRLILKELKKWMCPDDGSRGSYYEGFATIQRDLNFPLHVFSLNYDLCLEELVPGIQVESGFADYGPQNHWDWERFEQSEGGSESAPQIFLYKLHGSINWKRDADTNLFSVRQIESVEADQMEVIFGRDFKLEAADPYLFYAYQFRRLTLLSRLIVTIGYGFADVHINKMLTQGLRQDDSRRALVVARATSAEECEKKATEVAKILKVDKSKVIVEEETAESFLRGDNLGARLTGMIPKPPDAPF